MKFVAFLFFLWSALPCWPQVADPPPPPLKEENAVAEVEFEMLIVSLPEFAALPIIPELRDPSRCEKATQRILKMVESGRALLVGWPIICTKSGNRATAEQVQEFRHATEFEPPKKVTVEPGPQPPKKEPDPYRTKTHVAILAPMATAFETRNLGVTFEVEPIVGPDGIIIDVNFVIQHTQLLAMRKCAVEQKSPPSHVTVEMPEFENHKVTTSISMRSGERQLIGIFKTAKPAGNTDLMLLRAEVKKLLLGKH